MKVRYIFDRICLERVNFSFLRTLTCLKAAFTDINNDLSKLNQWEKLWLVDFNPKTTKALVISTSAVPHLDLRFNGELVADSNCTYSSFATSRSKHPSHTSQAYSNVGLMKVRYI
jgi:hypothetical protein